MSSKQRSILKEFLDNLGVEYDCPLETGAIAYLEGQSNHTIAFRADIDALPIFEKMISTIEVKRTM